MTRSRRSFPGLRSSSSDPLGVGGGLSVGTSAWGNHDAIQDHFVISEVFSPWSAREFPYWRTEQSSEIICCLGGWRHAACARAVDMSGLAASGDERHVCRGARLLITFPRLGAGACLGPFPGPRSGGIAPLRISDGKHPVGPVAGAILRSVTNVDVQAGAFVTCRKRNAE